MMLLMGNKVQVSRLDVALFNGGWPCSTLRPSRSYWFEFDDERNLIDTDVPQHDDGDAATALSQDCERWLFDDVKPEWLMLIT